ncbi:MAG: c-type cytochrome [Bryobacteraceae bacterium]|nr:c-type cytochrome [Bryobacteraceae bacterium]
MTTPFSLCCRACACALVLLAASCGREASKPPFSPEQSIAMMQIADGYTVEPFAAEPDVVSPVAMEIDEDGRIYVVEDRGYPLNSEGRVGRIKLLEDTNGDGRPDRVTTFADQLVLPTGVMRWRKGILVTDAPDLWYLEDTNGDGKADVRKKMLTGFAFTNPQHTVNGPVYGLDNWIHLAHENPTTAIIFDKFSDRGSDITFVDRPEVALTERGRNIRFRPHTFEIEALSGPSQFGHAFDDFGRHFVMNNTYHARHEVIEARYLKRNPDLPVASAVEDISDHGRPAKVYPIVASTRFEMLTNIGEFTSACGMTFWRGGVFVAEPAHNVVHRDIYSPAGPTFAASRDREAAEFLASRDPWFRPVNFYAGPDGALYMMDFYRLVIEHPEWMSEEAFRQKKDLAAGLDRGRIYRITAKEARQDIGIPIRLGAAAPAELVQHLASENPWWRRTAQRLLVDRKPPEAAPLLAGMAASHGSPVARTHALWTLEGLGRLDNALIEKALEDSSPGVRENAIRLAEPRMAAAPELVRRLLAMETDPDARVRFQLLCTLGFISTPASQAVRDRLLAADFDNRWTQIAALSASPDEATRLFAFAVRESAPASVFRQAAAVIGARGRANELQDVLAAVSRPGRGEWRTAALEGLAAGWRGKENLPPSIERQLLQVFGAGEPPVRRVALRVLERAGLTQSTHTREALNRAAKLAAARNENADLRADAIGLLALSDPPARHALFESLVNPNEPESVQAAAVRAIGYIPGEQPGAFLLKNWRAFTADVRMEAADALLRDPARVPLVVAALKDEEIQPWSLAFRHRRQLIMHRDPAIRDAARPLLEEAQGERSKVIARYQPALERAGDPGRGKAVFESVCAKCHKLSGKGAEVGPDLATVRHQTKQVLLTAILDPNQSISQGYEAYVVERVSGGAVDGVMGPQTATTITLRHEEGKEDVIPRSDIRNMYAANLSAMPADLEKQVDVQQMADLLEYIKAAN